MGVPWDGGALRHCNVPELRGAGELHEGDCAVAGPQQPQGDASGPQKPTPGREGAVQGKH